MAFSAKSLLLLSILLSSIFIPVASECNNGNGCFYAKGLASSSLLEFHSRTRKLLVGNLARGSVKVDLNSGIHDGPTSSSSSHYIGNEEGHNKYTVDSELRWVPSGPDPLHHNGGSPKKPKITP